jgi:hypothetical protein
MGRPRYILVWAAPLSARTGTPAQAPAPAPPAALLPTMHKTQSMKSYHKQNSHTHTPTRHDTTWMDNHTMENQATRTTQSNARQSHTYAIRMQRDDRRLKRHGAPRLRACACDCCGLCVVCRVTCVVCLLRKATAHIHVCIKSDPGMGVLVPSTLELGSLKSQLSLLV